ncbi:MAG: EAL domain-containing protein [Gammaproteobacteria bacterium]|nr:EAL domain-containing protein [Gammaproteobacteria bacterium]
MAVIFVLTVSILLQFIAAFIALSLIRVSGGRLAWIALSTAIFLMAIRRCLTLYSTWENYPAQLPILKTELVALMISALVLIAVYQIRPLFEAIRRSEEELETEKDRIHVTLQSIGDGVVSTDIHGNIQYMNPITETLCSVKAAQARGKPMMEILNLVEESTRLPIPNPVQYCLESGKTLRLAEQTVLLGLDKSSEYSVEVIASPIFDQQHEIIGAVLVLHDVTELRGMARQLSYQATHDPLSGLINRREFERRLEYMLDSAGQLGQEHAMGYLDLDDFKIVNDTCGHIAGDEMLKNITTILEKNLRETDTLARLGGDEFGILLDSCLLDDAHNVIEKIRVAVSDYSFAWDNNIFKSSISIGLVPINADSGSLTDIMSAADSACYIAKERGRNRLHVFTEDDKAVAQRHGQMQWVQHIQRAIQEDRFQLFYQLIRPLSPRQGEKDHAEILLRLCSETGKLIPPGVFLPAAERYNLMLEIDQWVVSKIFTTLAEHPEWQQQVSMWSVNLSGQSLGEEKFLDYVLEQFSVTGIDFNKICFEITETSVISNITCARQFISVLKEKGCRFALDDFGSGLSSFSYLKTLAVDYLKIDGNFVRSLLTDKNDYNLVISINQIGHVMGIDTVAEFVEDEATLAALSNIGVDYVQGYAVAYPQALEDKNIMNIPALITSGR